MGIKSRGRKVISQELAKDIYNIYVNSSKSLKDIGEQFGFSASGVKKALNRFGFKTRSPAEAGPIQGKKRSGSNHWRKRKPSTIKKSSYRSMRILDEDGLWHKRRVHVILMERLIGRRLYAHECVHHIDGNKQNNDIANLQLMCRHDHNRLHAKEQLARELKGFGTN